MAPVVWTSSTRTTRSGTIPRTTSNPLRRSRCARPAPTCAAAAPDRSTHALARTGPARERRARSARPGRSRGPGACAGSPGTGTSTPASSTPLGAPAAICAAISVGRRGQAAQLQRVHERPRGAVVGQRRPDQVERAGALGRSGRRATAARGGRRGTARRPARGRPGRRVGRGARARCEPSRRPRDASAPVRAGCATMARRVDGDRELDASTRARSCCSRRSRPPTCMRWREVRREQGTLALPIWRLLVFLGGIVAAAAALISPIDALAEQALRDAHGPAPAAARRRADPLHPRPDEGAAAAGDAPDPAPRARRGPDRPPGLRDRVLRRGDVDLAHPGDVRRGARAPGHPRARAPHVRRRRASCTGGTCCRRSAAATASAAWARSSTWSAPSCSSACWASASRSRRTRCTTTTAAAPGA